MGIIPKIVFLAVAIALPSLPLAASGASLSPSQQALSDSFNKGPRPAGRPSEQEEIAAIRAENSLALARANALNQTRIAAAAARSAIEEKKAAGVAQQSQDYYEWTATKDGITKKLIGKFNCYEVSENKLYFDRRPQQFDPFIEVTEAPSFYLPDNSLSKSDRRFLEQTYNLSLPGENGVNDPAPAAPKIDHYAGLGVEIKSPPAAKAPRFEDTTPVDSFVPDTTPAAKAPQSQPAPPAVVSAPPAKADNQPTSSATIYLHILQAGLGAYVLALVIAFLTSQQSSDIHKSKPIKGNLSFFCGVLIWLSPLFSFGQLEIERQKIVSSILPEMLPTLALETLGITAVMIYGVFIGVKIWQRSPCGVQLAHRYLLTRLFVLPSITIFALMFMPPQPNKVLEAFGWGFLTALWEIIIVGAWWLYFAKSKHVKETYNLTQASPPLPRAPSEITPKDTPTMDPVKKSVLVTVAVFGLMLVFFMPYTVTEIRNAAGMKTVTTERCFIARVPDKHSSSFSLSSYEISEKDILLYLLVAASAGAVTWALSGRRK